jgi:AraC family transcriptional regulator
LSADGAKPALRIGAQVEEPALARLVLELHGAAAASADPVRALYRDTLTRAIAAQIVARYGGAPTARLGGGGHDPRIRRVLDHIEAHLAEPLTLEGLAAVAAMSPFHFAKVFKAQVGEPPHKYWAGKRVERAKALLRTTRLPIAEIAWRVGWENPSNFAQAFKAATGTTPGAWRAAA